MSESKDSPISIEFYKIVCQQYQKDIDRRMRMNQFFFTISASICVAASFVLVNKKEFIELGFTELRFLTFIGSILLMILSINVSWLLHIRAAAKIQRVQIQVIISHEDALQNRSIGAVYQMFYKNRPRFDRTFAERLIPASFLIFGVALLAQVVVVKL